MINPIKKKLKEGNIPIIKKKLDGGVVAEANNDGSIYLDKKVKTNSPQAKEAISHEKVHMRQMARGDLNYDDNNVYWKGKKYPREVMNEGSQKLPWEAEAYKNTNNMKKSPLKRISVGLSQEVLGQRAGMMEDELKMKADKHAAIGRATAQIAGRVPGKFGGSGQGSWGDPKKGGAPLNPTNKNKSPLKATPITAKTSSAVKFAGVTSMPAAPQPAYETATAEAAADAPKVVENPAVDIAETETQPIDEKKDEKKDENKDEKKEEKKGEATHVKYSNPSTSFEKGYEKQAAVKMHKKNKSKSPLKKRKSPIKGTIGDSADANNVSRVSQEVIEGVNVGETSGTITKKTTETDTEKMKDSSKEFAEKCGTKANPKAESYVNAAGTKIDCAWAADEDYDRDQDYEIETHVAYDDSYKPDETTTPDTPDTTEEGDQYNMGYHEAMDAKWSAGVQKRGRKKVDRNVNTASKKWDRKDGNIVNPEDGENFKSKAAYLKYVADAVSGNYNQKIGTSKSTSTTTKGTKGETITAKNIEGNPNYKEVVQEDGTIRYVKIEAAAKMGKNKKKSPFKQNGSKHLKAMKIEQKPTRRDSVASAYHNRHVADKTPQYKDSYYDTSRAKAAEIAKKFPNLDTYMKTEKGRASVGQTSANKYDKKKKSSAFKLKGWKAYN